MATSNANPSEWKAYEDFSYGIDTNRLPQSSALAGRPLTIEGGIGILDLAAEGGQVAWAWRDASGTEREGTADADVVQVADDTYFIDLWLTDRGGREAITAIVNRSTGRALTVHTHLREQPVPGEPLAVQSFQAGVVAGVQPTGSAPEVTRDLLGKRAFSVYSPNHAYEHIYLNSTRYCWQCLRGVQQGHGDTDLASYWKFADGQYLFAFREFRIPVSSVFFFNLDTGDSTGKFLGLHDDGSANNGKAGARFQILSETKYPDGYEVG